MSVVNVFASSQRVVMLTDASLYHPDGTLFAFEQKALAVQNWSGVISGRGLSAGIVVGLELAERYSSFDEFIAHSAPEIERWHKAAVSDYDGPAQTIIEIHAIGWSEKDDQPQAYFLRSDHHGFETEPEPAYTWNDHSKEDGIFYNDITARELWILHRQGAEPGEDFTAETFDATRRGIPLIEAQRRSGLDGVFGAHLAGLHVIGGQLWLSVVDREGARQGIIHEWPDAIGEPITPAAIDEAQLPEVVPARWPEDWPFEMITMGLEQGAIDPETLKINVEAFKPILAANPHLCGAAPMSRQQRRAAEKRARKAQRYARAA